MNDIEQPRAPDASEFRPIDRSRHELLVVDDNPASRYVTGRVLRAAGFRIREAANGAEAMRMADDDVSALVLDVHLPDIDGFELCRILRSRPSRVRVPVLHLTAAYVTDEDKVRGLDAGADAYLTHPVEPAVLVATIQALVRTRAAEMAMHRSEEKFRSIYSQAPNGICLLDNAGSFVDANPAMLALVGRPLEAIAGRPVSAFVPPDWQARVAAWTGRLDEAATPAREFPLVDAAGRVVHLEWKFSPHIEPGVNMGVVTDVSERLQLEERRHQLLDRERIARSAAERMNRMKDDLIAVLSHELRTPLNAIMGWTHVLQKRGGTEDAMRGLEAIERNGQMQARIISDILDMSRLNLGKMPLRLELIDAREVVESAVNALRPSMEANDNPVTVVIDPGTRPLRADSSRLQQVVWNLLSNAVKFSPRGAPIEVRLRPAGDDVVITVVDRGQGIPQDFLPLLFDRFTQNDAASNRQRGGLGLGLSIVKHLVEAHGGTVAASSEGVGLGARFDVTLPTAPQAPDDDADGGTESLFDPADDDEEPRQSLDALRILVVDDDPDAGTMLQVILSDRGATVRIAHSVDEALAALDVESPDLMVSDVGMPGRDGYDLIREIRRGEAPGARLPAIALTSFTRQQDREQALVAGFDEHCGKPLHPLRLVNQIRRLVGRTSFSDSASRG